MGYGISGHLGIAKETSWGTGVAATDYVKMLNETLALAIDRFDITNVHGSIAEPDDAAGVRRVEGSIEFAAHPVSIGYFLKSLFVQSSITVVASGFLWQTQFRSTTADFAVGTCAGQPYTLEVFRDVTSSHRYTGVVANQLTLGYAPNQDVRVTAGVIGKSASLIAKTTPTFPGSPSQPFTFDTASLSLAGAATARIEALRIVIDAQLEGIPALNASTEVAKVLRRGPQMVNLSGTIDFLDVAEYQDFVNQTERQLKVTVTKANSFMMSVDVPRMVYTAFPAQIGGRERLTVDFEAKAFYHSGSGTAIEVLLTTVKSDY
mgnify:CR=1 FL=1